MWSRLLNVPILTRMNDIVRIYEKTECVTAQKIGPHDCDAECRRNDHMYIHCFKTAPVMYGLPPGSV